MSVVEDNWDYNIDLNNFYTKSNSEFEALVDNVKERILPRIEDGFRGKNYVYTENAAQSHDEELKELAEKNIILRNQIDSKREELSRKQNQYENFKKDQKLISQEIKETHEAFLVAKKYYKKYLKMYHTIEARNGETQTIFLQFFTEAKRESENYSVRLMRNVKTGQYQLLSTIPKLPNGKEFERKLKETNDVPGALSSIRQAFIAIRGSKK